VPPVGEGAERSGELDRLRWRGNQLGIANIESPMTSRGRLPVTVLALVAVFAAGCGSAVKSGSSPPPSQSTAVVSGRVTASPGCGGPAACAPRPVVGPVEARDAGGRRRASTRSDGAGRYRLALPPGRYTLVASVTSGLPSCAPVAVTVSSSAAVQADIECDSGLR